MKDFDHYSDLIGKFLSGESTLPEKEELFAWTKADPDNRKFFEEMEWIWKKAEGSYLSEFESDTDSAWRNIQSGITSTTTNLPGQSGKIIPLSKRIRFLTAAAAILLLFAAGIWWFRGSSAEPALVEMQTGAQETREVLLPDGSRVWLNEQTVLLYEEDFGKRHVTLTGEAFFEVTRMETHPFTISSGEATTTVLGTSFNVRAYPNEEQIEVTVKTGTVQLAVSKEADQKVMLEAGHSGVVNRETDTVERTGEIIRNADSWKTKRLQFDDSLMKDVILTLERYFGKKIRVSQEAIYACTYSSQFDQPNLDEILPVIAMTLGLDLKVEGDSFLLEGKGCQVNQ